MTGDLLWLPKISSGWRRCRDGLSSLRDDRPLEAARRIARRTIQIACGSRSGDGISLPAACRPAAVRTGEAPAAHCRSLDLCLALSAVPLLARSRGCLQARDAGALASASVCTGVGNRAVVLAGLRS